MRTMRPFIRNFFFTPESRAEAGGLSEILFTYRLYCDDPKIRSVIVCHSQMEKEEVWPCVQGVAYPRIYTDDAVILFQDDKQRRYASTIHYNLKKLTDDREAALTVLKLGAEDPGVLLHYCSEHELDSESLEYYQKLAQASACTEEFRREIRRKILDYYAAHIHGEDLDHYLEKMDYREYALVDRPTLLEVLISRRMFRQAMGLVEEFGYEGLSLSSLLKLTSRMILNPIWRKTKNSWRWRPRFTGAENMMRLSFII